MPNGDVHVALQFWWQLVCLITCSIATIISLFSISSHFLNYRKPNEQRLTVRILLLVPLFSVTCFVATTRPDISQVYLDPIREIYEAFVIYTFFSYLCLILGGERQIITETSVRHEPIRHAVAFMGKIDLSNPSDFLRVKKGILQYVWFKPFYCIAVLICEVWKLHNLQFGLVLLYNASVTWSLYSLALFWRCLYEELKPFHPWYKFMCVKLIIFASYWQSIIIQCLSIAGVFGDRESHQDEVQMTSYFYQNAILCIEMIGFAILHSFAFPPGPYSNKNIHFGSRMKLYYALRDCFGGGDLKWDFKQTLLVGESYYNFKNFEPTSAEGLLLRNDLDSRMNRIQQGYRFSNSGHDNYWINYGSTSNDTPSRNVSNIEDEEWDNSIGNERYISSDSNYPVIWDTEGYRYSSNIRKIRNDIESRSFSSTT
ncbi:hypothetical protein KAFR_0G00720 [Kazachstania africana CBS 2517]|uniref:Uncharacterized protein n=1 Tax=Kazachstania africana (strain ATCC 22294 / BCRC 22015 / CBS 2517 / CECT 1963 / NBRC 1671 / NRRL Y-8276) TaxID=1071382 RepID=H2AXK5_KAZAF|nr:hypothetical protein KAFR_0G00720 [Kazachstania africana CBS 2517]CCF59105.1 hypothetical protein KAFR_0G00720 [Kazachstania africana CBS 2517]